MSAIILIFNLVFHAILTQNFIQGLKLDTRIFQKLPNRPKIYVSSEFEKVH